jgi:predicted nucleic-acid-binding protein
MKRFEEMNKKELANLTEEQISMMLDYECALAGIPLLPEVPVEPTVKVINPDVTVYVLGGLKFLNLEDAAKVLEILQSSELVSYDYSTRVIKPIEDYNKPSIGTEKYFSTEYYNSVLKDKQIADAALSQYKEAKKDYDDTAKARAEIVNEFIGKIEDAGAEEYAKERYKSEFERYLKLSEGDRTIAFNFLTDAHDNIKDFDDFDGFKSELVDAAENV